MSGVGDDANPCSRTAPCKTFAGAISKTAPGGAINVLDPGGFGAVTITKSITIEAIGDPAGVLVSGTNGININAGINDVVILRGLSFDGVGTGLSAISFNTGAKLLVENMSIRGFQNGINFLPSGTSQLVVNDTTISNSGISGITITATSTGAANVALNRVQSVQNASGLIVNKGLVTVRASTITGASNSGIAATGLFSLITSRVSVNDSTVSDCPGTGIIATGVNGSVLLSNTTVVNNNIGLNVNGGTITSFGNNRLLGNTTTVNPTSTVPQQ